MRRGPDSPGSRGGDSKEYGFKGKLTVVENGNDFASFMIGDRDEFKRNARQRLGIEEDAFHLLLSVSISGRKDWP